MAVIEVHLQKHRNKTEARQGEKAFLEWCDRNGLGHEGFVPVAQSDATFKGKRITFFLANYGSFQTIDGWLLYVTYRADILNHVRYHTWQWDGRSAVLASHNLNEFINI